MYNYSVTCNFEAWWFRKDDARPNLCGHMCVRNHTTCDLPRRSVCRCQLSLSVTTFSLWVQRFGRLWMIEGRKQLYCLLMYYLLYKYIILFGRQKGLYYYIFTEVEYIVKIVQEDKKDFFKYIIILLGFMRTADWIILYWMRPNRRRLILHYSLDIATYGSQKFASSEPAYAFFFENALKRVFH